jgi:hypothetical protein
MPRTESEGAAFCKQGTKAKQERHPNSLLKYHQHEQIRLTN